MNNMKTARLLKSWGIDKVALSMSLGLLNMRSANAAGDFYHLNDNKVDTQYIPITRIVHSLN